MKNLKYILALLIWLISLHSTSQIIEEWAGELNGSHAGQDLYDIELDEHGNLYSIGTFIDTVRYFDTIIRAGQFPYYESFLAKHSPDGKIKFIKQIGSYDISDSRVIDIAIKGQYVYVIGFADSVLYTEKDTIHEIKGEPYARISFIIKYDTLGNQIWTKQIISANATPEKIIVDDLGCIIVGGTFNNWILSGKDTIRDSIYHPPFLFKFNSLGRFLWGKVINGGGRVYLNSIETDSQNNIYCAGNCQSKIQINGNSYSCKNYFIKFKPSGSLDFIRTDPSLKNFEKIVCFGTDVYVLGFLANDNKFDSQVLDTSNNKLTFIGKLNKNGYGIWGISINGATAWDVFVSNKGIYTFGGYNDTLIHFSDTLINEEIGRRFILTKLSHNGHYNWVHEIGKGNYGSYPQFVRMHKNQVFCGGGFIRDIVYLSDTFKHYAIIGTAGIVFKIQDISKLITGITHKQLDVDNLIVYPNPTNGIIYMGKNLKTDFYNYSLINQQGQTVLKGNLDQNIIDLQAIKNGLYYLEITNKEGVKQVIKIIKQ